MTTILVINDHRDDLELYSKILKSAGYSVLQAVNGKEGLAQARQFLPDLILLDIEMPDMRGFEVCARLKEDPTTMPIPVLIITAHSRDVVDRVRGLDLGADDYLITPIDRAELLARIRARLRIYQLETELRQKNLELQRMAITDSLTQVYNRQYLMDYLNESLVQHRQSGQPLALLILDIDHFKMINDNYGHLQGDRTLAEVVAVIKNEVHANAILARYGGEEFAVVLPETGLEAACTLAEQICQAVRAYAFTGPEPGKPIHLTVSIGCTSVVPTDLNRDALIRRADNALYEAKGAGRDQWHCI